MRKLLLFTAYAFIICIQMSAQTDSVNHAKETFTYVEQMPEFPGGNDARIDFLKKNLRYPDFARNENITGRVVVHFVVTETGQIEDITIAQSGGKTMDAEIIRVFKAMPRWHPGKQNGKAVRVAFTFPLFICLE